LTPQSDFAVEQYQSATDLAWQVEGKPLTADRMERYSLLALEHLLDSTQAGAWSEALKSHTTQQAIAKCLTGIKMAL
jgi:hypothetical protein